jgi:hypothetical protein
MIVLVIDDKSLRKINKLFQQQLITESVPTVGLKQLTCTSRMYKREKYGINF